ncbi:hypothetical protein [Metasolibacillus sp.]|uniref:phage protein n=1 Tax=Metasolibacillus sp. TaxID=2703680 RepID=UPI0025E9618A|nr:hypothetical protein [Metasolibacillus sp.]MCT6926173.1 hypothetical protein [Metasolibacillus sp.]MCT6942394.1 hypothetical protein [Metasolibacillus sp.]
MSTKLFGRVVEIVTGPVKMNNTDLDIEFEILFDDDLAPNISTIGVYNLSQTTINQLKRGQKFTISAGYKAEKGIVLSGEIASTSTKRVGTDKLTTIKVLDSVPYKANKTLQRAYKKAIKADALIKDLSKALGLKVAVLKLPTNKLYKKGYSVNGEVLKDIQKIAKECGASCYISRGQTYIRPIKEGDNHKFVLKADTGLIGSPEYFEEERDGKTAKGYKVKSLLQYRMNTASIIKIESAEVKATVRVRKGKHVFKGNSYYTEVEAIL